MDLDGMTHFEWLQAKKARFVSAARKGGMSEAALARLPKPIVVKQHKLPPVVLVGAPEACPQRAEWAKTATPPPSKPKKPKASRVINAPAGRHTETTGDRLLYGRLLALAEEIGPAKAADIRGFRRSRHITFARNACWRLFREFTGLSAPAIAQIAGRQCHTSILQGIASAIQYDKLPDRVAFYWEMRTRLSALGYPLVEELGRKGRT